MCFANNVILANFSGPTYKLQTLATRLTRIHWQNAATIEQKITIAQCDFFKTKYWRHKSAETTQTL